MQKIFWIILGLWFCGLLAVRAETFQLADGTPINGDIVTFNDVGVTVRLSDDSYTNLIWTKFSQDTLKQFLENPKLRALVWPFIQLSKSDLPQKPQVHVQEVQRPEAPPKQSLLAAMFSSSVGIVVLLLIYAANLYAGFEIAVVHSRPIPLVMGVSAVLPFAGPIIFLLMPVKTEAPPVEEEAPVENQPQTFAVQGAAPQSRPAAPNIHLAAGSWQPDTSTHPVEEPKIQTFQRGQFMFNRRFFETKFSGFFGAHRSEAEKKLTMLVKATKGEFIVESIVRIGTNEVYFEAIHNGIREEIMVPFGDIKEIQLKPNT